MDDDPVLIVAGVLGEKLRPGHRVTGPLDDAADVIAALTTPEMQAAMVEVVVAKLSKRMVYDGRLEFVDDTAAAQRVVEALVAWLRGEA